MSKQSAPLRPLRLSGSGATQVVLSEQFVIGVFNASETLERVDEIEAESTYPFSPKLVSSASLSRAFFSWGSDLLAAAGPSGHVR